MSKSYAEKLKDPRWQKKRLEIMQRDGFACMHCGDDKSTLSVHHRYYVKGREVWAYPDFCLITVCENCHRLAHEDDDSEMLSEWENITETLIPNGTDTCGEFDLHCLIGLAKGDGVSHRDCMATCLLAMRKLWRKRGLQGWAYHGKSVISKEELEQERLDIEAGE